MPPSFLCGSPDLQKGADSEEAHGSPDGRSTSEMKGGHGDLVQLLFSCNLPPVAAPCDTSQHTHVFVPDLKAGKSLSPNFFFLGGRPGVGVGGYPTAYGVPQPRTRSKQQLRPMLLQHCQILLPKVQGRGRNLHPRPPISPQSHCSTAGTPAHTFLRQSHKDVV